MKDFYHVIKDALANDTLSQLIDELSADSNIVISTSSTPIQILPEAFYESLSGFNSLEHIYNRAEILGIEIPFAGIIDEKEMIVPRFFKGEDGDENCCDWEKGDLLSTAYDYAKKTGTKGSLGHTHPVFISDSGEILRAYGAICSRIYYEKRHLESFGDETSQLLLESGLYERFGGDYCEMFMRSQEEIVSEFFWILSPRLSQVGFFRIKEEGEVIYHPWKLVG